MALEDYLHRAEPRWTPVDPPLTATEVTGFADSVRHGLGDLPGDPAEHDDAPDDMRCVLSAVGGGWGVYGAGATVIEGLPGRQHRLQLLLDPAWLDRDLREHDVREPWLLAEDAFWAREQLERLLSVAFPTGTVLRASLAPEPYSAASGDGSSWPAASSGSTLPKVSGTVGPPVNYIDAAGNPAQGFLTAGHVVPDPAWPQVDIRSSAGVVVVGVHQSLVPSTIPTGNGRMLTGDIDAAIIDSGATAVTGVGTSGGAGHSAAVNRITAGGGMSGSVVGYAAWIATRRGAWDRCYTVAAPGGGFSAKGDSGAAVVKPASAALGTTQDEVIGIVLGGAAAVPGCKTALTYVQDIDAITAGLTCTLIP